ncbi:hypothetical protein LINPERPRIM_LOCUS39166 [Linum perenne]
MAIEDHALASTIHFNHALGYDVIGRCRLSMCIGGNHAANFVDNRGRSLSVGFLYIELTDPMLSY